MFNSMLSVRKIFKSKLRSSFGNQGRRENEKANSSRVRTVINEEYKEAFRTKSYNEICDKIQNQLETRLSIKNANSLSSSPIPSPPSDHIRLSEYLVEPRQETLISISENPDHHHFLTDYFDTSLEAGKICEFILHTIHQVRVDYHAIQDAIKREPHENCLYNTLASFALDTNPFTEMPPEKFHDLHESHQKFLQQLTSKCSKRKPKQFKKFIKRAVLIMGCSALSISLLILAIHSVVGVMAAPWLILSCLVLFLKKRLKREKREKKRREEEAQMDAAAKGIYILINDFDTMSRLVERVHDEMEHKKFAAKVCVRKGKKEALKEVVREFQMHELGFMEQLEELEMQIYLCFLDINRSRRLLIQELDK